MKLYQHQQRIIDEDPKKCGLFLGTGSGKTLTALVLARGSTLVICPKTQKEDRNWERENERLDNPLPLVVVSKEEFRRDHTKLAWFKTVIVDECHTALGATPTIRWVKKEPIPKKSQLLEALEDFVERTKPERLYLVTATIIRSPMTVWAASNLLGKAWDFYKWRDTFYFRLPMPGREVWTPKNDSDTKDRLARIVQSLGYVGRLEDYFDVPEQTYKTIHVDLTDEQKKLLKEIPFEYPDPIVLLGKKHQIENGILIGNEYAPTEAFKNGKIDTILELALEFPRMVIFAKYTAQLHAIQDALTEKGYNTLLMDGSVSDRGSVIAQANAAEACIFICQAQISAGWELSTYPVMVFASMTYSIVDRIQAEGRIHRANNLKKNLYITLVAKGGVDDAVNKAIINKQDFSERVYLNL